MRNRIVLLMICLAAVIGIAAVANAQVVHTFTVTNNGATSYGVDGAANPTLTLTRGKTYAFSINTPGHPFDIKTAPTTGTGDRFTDGVSAQGVSAGTVMFTVPQTSQTPLFYQCEIHSVMSGQIDLVAPTPAGGFYPLLGLGLLVLGAGYFMLRRRRVMA
jgi:hypothetical protein